MSPPTEAALAFIEPGVAGHLWAAATVTIKNRPPGPAGRSRKCFRQPPIFRRLEARFGYVENIYEYPDLYDLEHAEPSSDLRFFCRMAEQLQPSRILEVGCGTGRLTIPLAKTARAWKGKVVGLDREKTMLEAAAAKTGADEVEWVQHNFQHWNAAEPFDLIISACSSLSHLLETHDQLAAWQSARANLKPGGSFVVAELMADFSVLAQSMQTPPRICMELDTDHSAPGEQRLIRYKATRYSADAQSARVHYLYDHFDGSPAATRRVADYVSHVYFPNEMRLLFHAAGFTEITAWGDYDGSSLMHDSRHLIMRGRRR